ncbi:endospore germination permease [Wukongibacter baidiensis]|uniref:GerAB/ArcD/ProY family transporter n=1 Tax=Wukongibacter baidiensis TaxID=1723361 RepID=UPI003D7F266B
MNNDIITDKQGIVLITLFIMGSSLIIGTGSEAGKDSWIAIIIAMLFSYPILMIYARILSLYPNRDLLDILEYVFGKIFGRFIGLVFTWFAFHLGALVIRNFGEFINDVSIPETPEIILMIFIALLCAIGIKAGVGMLCRWSELVIVVLIFFVIISVLLLIPDMNLNNIKPIFGKGLKPILLGSFSVFSFPFAETILFCMVFSSLSNKKSPYTIYTWGMVLGGTILFIATLTEILVLGETQFTSVYFPSHITVSRANIGDFVQRSEIIVAISFLGAGFVKVYICLLGACKGVVKTFGCSDYKFIAIPIALLTVNLAHFIYESLIEMSEWAFEIWPYYAFIFQVVLPIIVWIGAEIKHKSSKRTNIKT